MTCDAGYCCLFGEVGKCARTELHLSNCGGIIVVGCCDGDAGSGKAARTEVEPLAKFEIMDGAPVRGEIIPIRCSMRVSVPLLTTAMLARQLSPDGNRTAGHHMVQCCSLIHACLWRVNDSKTLKVSVGRAGCTWRPTT